MIADPNVCAESTVRDDAADGGNAVKIPFSCVFSVHEFQDAIGTALYRQVDMSANVRMCSNDLQRFVAHVFGVGGRKADSHGGNGFGNNGKKLRKTYVSTLVAVDILPEQSNFNCPLSGGGILTEKFFVKIPKSRLTIGERVYLIF